jgi:hypothetical protein
MNKNIKLTWHSDPSHGWLAVPLNLIKLLNIADKISRYSYIDKNLKTVYLEEDCDAPQFISAAIASGIQITMAEHCYTDSAPIRDLPRF